MARRSTTLALWLGIGSFWGCAAAPTTVVVNNTVSVSVSDGTERGKVPPSIDANDPRIQATQTEITKLIGNPLSFELDGALVPAFGDRLHTEFIAALQSTVTQLEYCRDHRAKDFQFGRAHLQSVRWVYTASKYPEKPKLNPATGVLSVVVASDAEHLLVGGMLIRAFIDARDNDQLARFRDLPANKVAGADQVNYFEFQASEAHPSLATLANVLALYPAVSEPKLRTQMRAWLVARGDALRSEFTDSTALPASELALGVHATWVRWLNEHRAELDLDEQREITRLVFRGQYAPWSEFRKGIDIVALAKPHLDAWLRAKRTAKEAPNDAILAVACPYTRDGAGTFRTQGDCNGALYADPVGGADATKQLAQLCVREKVDALTQTVTLHRVSQLGVVAGLKLLDALQKDEPAFRAALLALADFSEWGPRRPDDSPGLDPKPLLARIPGWWTAHPARRPELMLLLTELGERYQGKVVSAKLPETLGTRITAADLTAFLDLSPRSLAALSNFASGLSDGWSRAAVVIPKLQAWLNAFDQGARSGPSPHYVTERVFEFLCNAGTARDITELHAFVRSRVDTLPEAKDQLVTLAQKTPTELCPKFKYDASSKPILFGD